ncbi:Protein CBG10398 [Caenorhabditis briggsae]|uniref:Protein CBG10398 n=1 Tax=Caenorhabditis briggsae TaxID=6238 RepID=A8XB41_CAEBR|nr:Protein CBG10398 [Caenorhabditis briggsae]CAP29821.2 Protein CBG10398 [Caenorhabditis briggsae]
MTLPYFDLETSVQTGFILSGLTLYPAIDAFILMFVVTDYRKAFQNALKTFSSRGSRSHSPPMKDPIEHNKRDIEKMNENLKYYEKFVKKIYILGAHPLYQHSFVDFFLQNLINRPEIPETLHMNRWAAENEMKIVRKRFSMVKCENCEVFELTSAFLYGDKYLTFDEEESISYVDNTGHLTSAGLKLCNPILRNITQELMRTI